MRLFTRMNTDQGAQAGRSRTFGSSSGAKDRVAGDVGEQENRTSAAAMVIGGWPRTDFSGRRAMDVIVGIRKILPELGRK